MKVSVTLGDPWGCLSVISKMCMWRLNNLINIDLVVYHKQQQTDIT